MAIIVKHKRSSKEYILLATNFGRDKGLLSSRFLNDLFTKEDSENSCLLTLCDSRGNIFLAPADSFVVTNIDGQKLLEILPESVSSSSDAEFNERDYFEEDSKVVAPEAVSSSTFAKDANEFENDDEDWI
jgi:hypothetical protein